MIKHCKHCGLELEYVELTAHQKKGIPMNGYYLTCPCVKARLSLPKKMAAEVHLLCQYQKDTGYPAYFKNPKLSQKFKEFIYNLKYSHLFNCSDMDLVGKIFYTLALKERSGQYEQYTSYSRAEYRNGAFLIIDGLTEFGNTYGEKRIVDVTKQYLLMNKPVILLSYGLTDGKSGFTSTLLSITGKKCSLLQYKPSFSSQEGI